jgi:membrane protein YdbS with pleckstrin-like domain
MSTSPPARLGTESRTYRGIKGVIAGLLRIPLEPATIPVNSGELLDSFHPAPAWIRLRQIQIILGVCLALLGVAGASLGLWFFGVKNPPGAGQGFSFWIWGALETAGFIFILVSGVVRLIFLRLQYDCTWYVLTTRAMRIRRGLWVIQETTITYDNIQNVTVKQGPIQRLFKLSDIEVETAGGGGSADSSKNGAGSSHSGRIEGVVDPQRLRERIMTQVRLSRSSGLGDGDEASRRAPALSPGTTPEWGRLAKVLKEIRDDLRPSDLGA